MNENKIKIVDHNFPVGLVINIVELLLGAEFSSVDLGKDNYQLAWSLKEVNVIDETREGFYIQGPRFSDFCLWLKEEANSPQLDSLFKKAGIEEDKED